MKDVAMIGGIIFALLGAAMMWTSFLLDRPKESQPSEWRANQDKWTELDKEFMCEVGVVSRLFKKHKKFIAAHDWDKADSIIVEIEKSIERQKTLAAQMKALTKKP